MTSQWRHHQSNFVKFKHKFTNAKNWISFWLDKRELRCEVGKLTKNFEEKVGITSLWPWPLTQGLQFQKGPSQCSMQPFSKNRVQIGASVRLEFCSLTDRLTQSHTHLHTHTHTHTYTLTHTHTHTHLHTHTHTNTHTHTYSSSKEEPLSPRLGRWINDLHISNDASTYRSSQQPTHQYHSCMRSVYLPVTYQFPLENRNLSLKVLVTRILLSVAIGIPLRPTT